MSPRSARQVRCAIYTRVSTDQGLEQDFSSLDAQYDASQAYIRSQTHAAWTLLRTKYVPTSVWKEIGIAKAGIVSGAIKVPNVTTKAAVLKLIG